MTKTSKTLTPSDSSTNEELKALLTDAEKALSSAGNDASEEIVNLRERLRNALSDGSNLTRRAVDMAKEQAKHADEFVHEKPYVAVGIAAGLGLIAGVLATGCCNRRNS